ncbi:hypothetical protein [Natronomonas aquatica]
MLALLRLGLLAGRD